LKYKTVQAYRGGVNSFIKWLELVGVTAPVPDDLYDYLDYLQKEGRSVFTQGLYMVTLKKFFKYLSQPYQGKNLQAYPDIYTAAKPKVPRPGRDDMYREMPTEDEIKRLRVTCSGQDQASQRDGLMIDLGLYGGLRVNEIANVKVEDLKRNGEVYELRILRKGKYSKMGSHPVFINADLGARIEVYAEKWKRKEYIFGDTVHNGSSRPRLNAATVSSIIADRMKAAGIKRPTMTAHSLRHYAGTTFYNTTKDIYTTKEFMGHSDIQTTMKYMHMENNYRKAKIALQPAIA
jgi:integrase